MLAADQSAVKIKWPAPSGFSSAAQEFVLTFLLMMELIRTTIGNSIEIEVQDVFSRGRSENRYCLDQKTWTDGSTIEPKKERKSRERCRQGNHTAIAVRVTDGGR